MADTVQAPEPSITDVLAAGIPTDAPPSQPQLDAVAQPAPVQNPEIVAQPVQQTAQQVAFDRQLRDSLGIPDHVPNGQLLAGAVQAIQQYSDLQAKVKQYEEQLASRAAVPPVKDVPQSLWDARPEWKPEWARYVQRSENGVYTAKPGADPSYAAKANAAAAYQEQVMERLTTDPRGAFKELIAEELKTIREEAAKVAQEQLKAARDEQAKQNFIQTNWGWMVQHGPDGKPATDVQGGPLLTPKGNAFYQALHVLESAGVADWQARANLAALIAAGAAPQQTAPSPVAQQQREADRTAALVRQGSQTRVTTQSPPQEPANLNTALSPRQRLQTMLDGIVDESDTLGTVLGKLGAT